MSGEYSKKSSDASSWSRADEIVVNTFMTFFAYLYGELKKIKEKLSKLKIDSEGEGYNYNTCIHVHAQLN